MKYYSKKKVMMKIMMVPYPALGHVTPMLKLASAFLNLGLHPVLVIPEFIYIRIQTSLDPNTQITCIPIPDGLELDCPRDFFSIEYGMENHMPLHLESIIRNLSQDGGVIACMVVDLLASWAIQVAHRFRIPAAGFWPAMLATYSLIAAIPDLLRTGYISDTGYPQHTEKSCILPNQPMLSTEDLPWLIGSPSARKSRFKFWTRTLERSTTLKWLLVNSFPEEQHYIDINIKQQYSCQLIESSLVQQPLVYPIGPLSKHAITKNPSFCEEEDTNCLEWLDDQNPNSVIYISFGSWVSPIGEAKVRNLALSLEALNLKFIWVLGFGWREGLPTGFLERVSNISKQGKVVSWAPQMEVLQHKAVGCYLTHCGWNSTMEAIESQKRILCYPVAGDQSVNCAHIVKVWKIGVQLNGFGEKDIEQGMKKVMEDSEMKNRLMKMHTRIMGDEAKSRVMSNLTAFVDDLNNLINDDHDCYILKDVHNKLEMDMHGTHV
ncbi:hypothetical protein EZV62_015582 [Acer yangbiense]|uniref:Glycosyltransferase n=1 Tax=Acer yangbiense TaxID=1000413 RepID=A0A5C7HL87_9ROSI|nr:hypothetical protein EZV62_015582 [Acer yangbiense]